MGRAPYKRKFELTFLEENSAQLFFEVYVGYLPAYTPSGSSYFEMRNGEKLSSCNYDSTTKSHNNWNDENVEEQEENEVKQEEKKDVKGVSNWLNETAESEEVEKLKFILEQSNWAESQDLFNPMCPTDFDDSVDDKE